MGDQKWEKTEKRHFVGFARNIPSPHQLTLERAEGVAVDPLSLQKSNRKPESKNWLRMFPPYFYFRFSRNLSFLWILSNCAREGGNMVC